MKKLIKSMLLAVVPMMVLACTVRADENDFLNELASGDLTAIADADNNVEDFDLDDVDVDALAGQAGQDEDQAVEACFRRFGYRSYSSRYYYPSYGHRYSYYTPTYSYYRPLYNYHSCYTSYYTPVYSYSYWGCY